MIIWIASYPKSGNTYLRSFLASYYFSKKGKFDFNLLMNIPQFPSIRFSQRDFLSFSDASKNWISNQKFFFNKEELFFLKTHNSLCRYENFEFTTQSESIGAIYIVRDPRNVITSMCNHYSFNLEYALEKMSDKKASLSEKASNGDCSNFTFLGSWSDHYKSWKNNDKFKVLFIKYEDLKENKELIFKKVIDFIERLKGSKQNKFDENKFFNSIRSTNFVNLKNKEINEGFEESKISSMGKKINFFNMGFKNDWKKLLPQSIIKKIDKQFEKELSELGYN
tara:strand:+ start:34 stop:873 length:840 start_codon:yes stop_codon:yes gene_type:complete